MVSRVGQVVTGVGSRRAVSSIPWWRVAATVLLGGALFMTISAGRTVEAVIIGVLTIPSLVALGIWIYAQWMGVGLDAGE